MFDITFFRHHDNERDDQRVQKILARHGASGYGIYWYVMERLYFSVNRELQIGERFYKQASIVLSTTKGRVRKVVEMMVEVGLVTKEDGYISSERVEKEVMEMIAAKKRRKEAAVIAGRASAVARQTFRETS